MKTIRLGAICTLLFCLLSGCGGGADPSDSPTAPSDQSTPSPTATPSMDPLGELMATMTVEEKVGQLLVVGVDGTTPGDSLKKAVQEDKVGGVILFSHNVESADQLVELTNGIKTLNGGYIPLLISVDQEGGLVDRMPSQVKALPSAYTFGAIEEEGARLDTCYRLGTILAEECQAFGFNVNFAPVLDVWSNPKNTVIGKRAFGSEEGVVTAAAPMVAYGMMDSGVIPVVKHFPGHGDTAVDSHVGLPVVEKSLEELEALELRPFREAIRQGRYSGTFDQGRAAIPAVMVGHILMTQLDEELPATLSPGVVNGLLREELGFQGVVFTDDLTMGAITESYGMGEAAVLAIEAGCDQLLICHGTENIAAARTALLEAVEDGRITYQRLEESLRRILSLKRDYGLTDDSVPRPDLDALNAQIDTMWAMS